MKAGKDREVKNVSRECELRKAQTELLVFMCMSQRQSSGTVTPGKDLENRKERNKFPSQLVMADTDRYLGLRLVGIKMHFYLTYLRNLIPKMYTVI